MIINYHLWTWIHGREHRRGARVGVKVGKRQHQSWISWKRAIYTKETECLRSARTGWSYFSLGALILSELLLLLLFLSLLVSRPRGPGTPYAIPGCP